jgi:hypothetical protein
MTLAGLVAANNLNDVTDIERTWDNIGSNLSATVFVPAPSLDLNFAASKSLVDSVSGNNLITFSRASTGTFVGSNGLIQTAASGVARFDHNGATGESLGLLIEEARANAFTYSEQFDNAAWTKSAITIIANATTAPDGTLTADKIVEDTSNSEHCLTIGVAESGPSVSIFAKASERSWLVMYIYSTTYGDNRTAYFNLSDGVLGTVSAGVTASIQKLPNGWCRVSISTGTGSFPSIRIGTAAGNGVKSYTGGSAFGLFVWGAQLEYYSFPTSYIPTTSATVTRAADVADITGSNFTSWYNQSAGTIFVRGQGARPPAASFQERWYNGTSQGGSQTTFQTEIWNGITGSGPSFSYTPYATSSFVVARDNSVVCNGAKDGTLFSVNGAGFAIITGVSSLAIGRRPDIGAVGYTNGTISRIAYYSSRLPDNTLKGLSAYGVISNFPYSFSIKGKDILALKQVNRASTRDFIFIKGLTSNAQARITTASQYTASGVALRNVAMLKTAPTTVGNYFFPSGLTVSGVSCQINGTNALSIATSPFSGSDATAPLLFAGLRPQTNWRMTEAMTSGTVTAPESAIPIETENFLLFIKAGQG